MKVVRGTISEYQLVEKTKRKDIDGVAYLVAGERSLWVKLLKDRSSSKHAEIVRLISEGKSTGFEKPLEVVTDGRGFAGYTFEGKEMDVVPVISPEKKKKPAPVSPKSSKPEYDFETEPIGRSNNLKDEWLKADQKTEPLSESFKYLLFVLTSIVLSVCLVAFLNDKIAYYIYAFVSEAAGQGCAVLSIHGVLPASIGLVVQILFHKSLGKSASAGAGYLAIVIIGYLVGMLGAYLILSGLGILGITVFGFVKTYQSAILTVIVLFVLIKVLWPKK